MRAIDRAANAKQPSPVISLQPKLTVAWWTWLAALFVTTATTAAGAPAEGSIVVTGSRIPRPNFDTVQPSTVLNSQALEQRGFVDAADALNELPQFGVPGSSPVGAAQGGAFGTGQSFVNFLGLGSQRTLVLINGRRFISSDYQPTTSLGPVVILPLNIISF